MKGNSQWCSPLSSARAGKEVAASVAGIEDVTLMRNGFGGDVLIEGTAVPLGGLWADGAFF